VLEEDFSLEQEQMGRLEPERASPRPSARTPSTQTRRIAVGGRGRQVMRMDRAAVPIVSDYMTPGPYFVSPDESLPQANVLMREHGIRHLPVVKGRDLVGILSDRDLNLVQTLAHARPEEITVEDAMTAEPYAVSPDAPLNEVARVMLSRKIGSAVVMDGRELVGVFTVTDGLQALVEALEGTYSRRTYDGVTTEPPAPRRPSDLR
jgi:acetoin utilization protein AcuB